MQRRDLHGQRFGRLVVVELGPKRTTPKGRSTVTWMCECECGNRKVFARGDLIDGKAKSCGCLRKENSSAMHTRHGNARRSGWSREYLAWASMIARCTNSKRRDYSDYGGRGISVCERWRHDFAAFLADMGRKPSPRHSIDRIDVNGNYEPSNCRWATPSEQAKNRRPYQRAA